MVIMSSNYHQADQASKQRVNEDKTNQNHIKLNVIAFKIPSFRLLFI